MRLLLQQLNKTVTGIVRQHVPVTAFDDALPPHLGLRAGNHDHTSKRKREWLPNR